MMSATTALLLVASLNYAAASMTNSWAVQITSGGEEAADELASKYGFINLGQVHIPQALDKISKLILLCRLVAYQASTTL